MYFTWSFILTVHFGIGIDTARFGHHVSFMDEQKRTAAAPFHFEESYGGYQKLLKILKALVAKADSVHLHIRLDVAGQYAENLITWLRKLDLSTTISIGTPAKNKAYREAHYDKRKADPVESLACARFAIVERPAESPVVPKKFSALRATVSALESEAKHRTRLINQLHSLLAHGFPELAKYVTDIDKGYCLALLLKHPTAKKIAAAKLETIMAIAHMKEDLAKTLHEAAKTSTASASCEIHQSLTSNKVREILDSKEKSAQLLKLMKKAWDSLPDGAYKRVYTIKGIGLQTAAALVAKIISIDRFQCDSALIGYFGIFPEEKDVSGTERDGSPKPGTIIHMCAKGNDLVRRLLYMAAQSASMHNPAVKALFARQAAQAKPYNLVIGHCMAKLLRQVFAVWTKDQDYDPDFESAAQQPATTEKENVVGPKSEAVKPHRQEVTTTQPSLAAKPNKGKRPPLNYVKLKSQLPIIDVLHRRNWQQRTSRGAQLRGPCPLHASQPEDRCFAVHTGKNTYCCHSCGCKGNAIDLVTALSKKETHEACWDWIELTNMEPPLL